MSFINERDKEIHCKIVYFGPAFAGKSTSLKFIYEKVAAGRKVPTLSEEKDGSLFFDFVPLSLGKVKGYTLRVHLYSVPEGNVHESSRKLILKGVDGLVFVVDSRMEKTDENLESWTEEIAALRKLTARQTILDLCQVWFLSAKALEILIAVMSNDLYLLNCSMEVRNVLHTSGLSARLI